MGRGPENRDSGPYFLEKNSPVAFRSNRRISLATGEMAISRGTSSEKILRSHFQPPENADFVRGGPQYHFYGPVACGQRVAIWLGTSSQPHVSRNESEREWIWGCLSPCRSPSGYEKSAHPSVCARARTDMCESDHDCLIMSGYAREWVWVRRRPPTRSAFLSRRWL